MKCICGHWHTATCHCGCPYPDDGEHDAESDLKPDWKVDRYEGIYAPPGGYPL
jgi:hypothetical protein